MSSSKLVKHSTLTASLVSLMNLSGLLGACPSSAATINGGFETGDFTGWSRIGDSSIQTANSFGSSPIEGVFEAFLSTASVADDNFNFSGIDAVSSSNLETFLGLKPGSLNNLGNGGIFPVTEGAAIKQTFTANAGNILSFNYNFLTDEEAQSKYYNSFAFIVVNNSTNELADTFSILNPSSTFFNQETRYQSFSTVLPTSGTYTLGLGIVDRGEAFSSGLLIDNVQTTPIPEPSPTLGVLAFVTLGAVSQSKSKMLKRR